MAWDALVAAAATGCSQEDIYLISPDRYPFGDYCRMNNESVRWRSAMEIRRVYESPPLASGRRQVTVGLS